MPESIAQMEIIDSVGVTETFAGTVNATGISLPPTPGDYFIDDLGIRCTIDQPESSRLEFSYDGGANWLRLGVGESREDSIRGSLTQIKIRAAGALPTCKYEVVLNRGPR